MFLMLLWVFSETFHYPWISSWYIHFTFVENFNSRFDVDWAAASNSIERMQGFFTQLFDSQGKVTVVIKLYAAQVTVFLYMGYHFIS
jgi:hypothetical protein